MACVHRVLSASTDYRLDSFDLRLLFSSALVPTFCSWALQAQDLTGGTFRTWPIGTGNAPTVHRARCTAMDACADKISCGCSVDQGSMEEYDAMHPRHFRDCEVLAEKDVPTTRSMTMAFVRPHCLLHGNVVAAVSMHAPPLFRHAAVGLWSCPSLFCVLVGEWFYLIVDLAFTPSHCAAGVVRLVVSAPADYRLDSIDVWLLFSSALVPTFCSWALQAQDLTGGTLRTWPIGTGNAPTVGIDELDAELTLSLCEVASHVHLLLSFGLRS